MDYLVLTTFILVIIGFTIVAKDSISHANQKA